MTDKRQDKEEAKVSENEISQKNQIENDIQINQTSDDKSNNNMESGNKEEKLIKKEKDKKDSKSEHDSQEKNKKEEKSIESNENKDNNFIENPKGKSLEKNKTKSISKKSEKLNEDSISSISINSSAYKNSTQNLSNLEKIRNGLKIKNENVDKFEATYQEMNKEEAKLEKLYEKEERVNEERIGKKFIMDDDIFENRTRKILSDVYDLKEYLSYPYFTVEYCSEKKANMVKIYYYQIDIGPYEEMLDKNEMENPDEDTIKDVNDIASDGMSIKTKKEKSDKKCFERFLFLDDRETYMTCYKEMPMIFQKNKDLFYSVNIISTNFESSAEFLFKKENRGFTTTFIKADVNKELLEAKGEMTKTKNEVDSLENNENKKKELNIKLEQLNKTYNSMKKKYSKQNLEGVLKKKNEELKKYNDEIKLEKNKQKIEEYNTKIINIQKEIKNCEMLMSAITIRIEKKDQEFDGLFFSTKEINLKNNIGDSLTIPPQSPIIIEVKNITNYSTIVNNIRTKKKKLNSLKLNESNFYFIGIIRNIDINEEQKKEINQKKKSVGFNNMIVIYPDGLNFLDVPLYENKTKTELANGNNFENFMKFVKDKLEIIEKKLDKIDTMERDINDLKKRKYSTEK